MIRHIVFFKFKPDATAEQKRNIIAELRALPQKIDVIRHFEVGEDVLRLARSWDVALVGTYDSLEALKTYDEHPAHKQFVAKVREVSEGVASVDFEC
jgi:quinol monooxygenase YgiN